MDAKDRIESPKLVPSHEEFTIGLILFAAGVVVDEETANVLRPPRIAGHGHFESACHLGL